MIRVLEKTVADKIAAGEVIERPVSIVKELVENSIDAGATSVIVEIKKGGKSYIRVTDNGCGIEAEEAEKAFLRHATSKIEIAADLNSIRTLGFRGEALASICAVTHTELITKTEISKTGTKVLIHGGQVIENTATGCPEGTTIIVSDLFYNTPARLKFMKSDSAESSKIIEFVSEIALAYSEIKFRLINNGNIIFSTAGDNNGLNTILEVFKQKEYSSLIPFDYSSNNNRVYGYLSKPALTRPTRKDQIFYVNGRVINSKVIEKGISIGYNERLFEGRFPVAFLFLETDPHKLDVNIHPNKREVRFNDEQEIVTLISIGIQNALGTSGAVIQAKDVFKMKEENSEYELSNKNKENNQVDIKQILSAKSREIKIPIETKKKEPEISIKVKKKEPEISIWPKDFSNIEDSNISDSESDQAASNQIRKNVVFTENIEAASKTPFDFDDLSITGSIFGTYITATDNNSKSFYLIDQHAAHERIFYEKLVGEYLSDEKIRQPILTPIIIEVSPSINERAEEWLPQLLEMGFDIENFGQSTYRIREIPTFMKISEAEDFAKSFTDSIEDSSSALNSVVINKLITKSCKSAVKAHDYLKDEEIYALINQLKECRNPFSCPHGRPTFIRLSKYEIERMFKRV